MRNAFFLGLYLEGFFYIDNYVVLLNNRTILRYHLNESVDNCLPS
jgi:hypothetical protein